MVFLDRGSPQDIAQGVCALLSSKAPLSDNVLLPGNNGLARQAARQEEWLDRHSWLRVARRLRSIVEKPIARDSVMERNEVTARFVAALVAEREASEEVLRDQIARLNAQLETAQQQAAEAVQRELELNVANTRLEREVTHATAETEAALLHASGLEARAKAAESQLAALISSTSWRMTRPLRSIMHRARRLIRWLPLGLRQQMTHHRTSNQNAPAQMLEWNMTSFRLLEDDALMAVRAKAALTYAEASQKHSSKRRA